MKRILEELPRRGALKVALYALLIGAFFGGAGTALAGFASSPSYYYGPVYGYSYYNLAVVETGTSGAEAGTAVSDQSSSVNVPTGYMGAFARLYNGNNVLVESSGWYYNNQPLNGISYWTSYDTTHGTYYSYGITAAYNGNGYNDYYTYQSPEQNY